MQIHQRDGIKKKFAVSWPLSALLVEADERMKLRGGSLRWIYQREMEHHFEMAVYDTLRLLQVLTHGGNIATSANLKALCENGGKIIQFILPMRVSFPRH